MNEFTITQLQQKAYSAYQRAERNHYAALSQTELQRVAAALSAEARGDYELFSLLTLLDSTKH